ncbi:hypothetical protein ASF91_17240 [Rhizobium sp. Leaf155]|nr:hypothetical protein ASF91_17240 [Rhizobium sp. Leaf155]
MPDRLNDYQLPSWPPTKITREIWNAVLGDIGVRLREREALEASFELLQQQGIQAALDYIQVSVAPQLSDLQRTIQESKEQIDDLLQGNAPNAQKLGGQLPAYYAKASEVQSLLQVVADKADADDVTALIQQRIAALVDSSPATLDTLKELAAALNNDANFSVTVTSALAELETKIKQAGAPIGTTIMMQGNGNTPPPGYLLHNGAPCTSAYPQLRSWLLANGATVNGNGDPIIEDMGGYFARGWRPGQVVDSGRVFGSVQQDALQDHKHRTASAIADRVTPSWGTIDGTEDFTTNSGYYANAGVAYRNLSGGAKYPVDANGTPRVAAETRPANKTFTYWIKAYASDQVPGSVDFAALANNVQALQTKVNLVGVKTGGKLTPTNTAALLYAGLPANIYRFTVHMRNISFSTAAQPQLRLGTSAGITASGYVGQISGIEGNQGYASGALSIGVGLCNDASATSLTMAEVTFTRIPGTNEWTYKGQATLGNGNRGLYVEGIIALPGELDRFQITTTAGTANISGTTIWPDWEFAA